MSLASGPRTGISRTKPASTPNAMATEYWAQSTLVAISATIAASPAAAANGARFSRVRSAGSSAGCSVGVALSIGAPRSTVMQPFSCMTPLLGCLSRLSSTLQRRLFARPDAPGARSCPVPRPPQCFRPALVDGAYRSYSANLQRRLMLSPILSRACRVLGSWRFQLALKLPPIRADEICAAPLGA